MRWNITAKTILSIFLNLCFVFVTITDLDAQQRRRKVGKGGRPIEIMAGLDEAASFRGQSEGGFKEWVIRNVVFPEECIRKGVQGTVVVGFNVSADGDVENVKLNEGYHPALDKEAKRVVSSSPQWVPAYKSGSQVSTPFVVPVIFEFDQIKEKTALRPGIVQSYKNSPLQFVKEAPKFEGGDFAGFIKFFNRYVVYPYSAKRAGIGGKVLLKLTIGGDNQVWGISARGPNKILEDEVYRVMNYKRALNGWTAGREAGQNVNTECMLVVTFDHDTRIAQMSFGETKPGQTLVYNPPVFLGEKNNDFRQFVSDNLRYPIVAQENKVEGVVVVDFVINTKGKVDSIQIVNGVHNLLDKEAIRVLRMSNASMWQPARYSNNVVNVHYWFPFVFSLDQLSPLEQLASDIMIGSCEEPPLFNNREYTRFFEFVDANIIDINPNEVKQKTVVVSFILESSGRILNVKHIGSIGDDVEMDEVEEALRVVNLSEGYWTPAHGANGRPTSIQIVAPIRLYDKSRYE